MCTRQPTQQRNTCVRNLFCIDSEIWFELSSYSRRSQLHSQFILHCGMQTRFTCCICMLLEISNTISYPIDITLWSEQNVIHVCSCMCMHATSGNGCNTGVHNPCCTAICKRELYFAFARCSQPTSGQPAHKPTKQLYNVCVVCDMGVHNSFWISKCKYVAFTCGASTLEFRSINISAHQFTSAHISTHQHISAHISTHQNTSVHISTHQ